MERRKGRGDHGLAGASTDPADTSPVAEDSDQDPVNGADGEAYEDNWYRSLKAFAAARQAFGEEPEVDADDAADAESLEDETPAIEPLPNETPEATVEPPPLEEEPEEEQFVEGSAPPIRHVEAVAPGTTGELSIVWRNLQESPAEDRGGVVERLQHQGKGPDLVRLVHDHARSDTPSERALAVELAGRTGGEPCVEIATAALEDLDTPVRMAAARAIGEMRPGSAAEALGRRTQDPDPEVRSEIVRALGVIDHPSILGSLFAFLSDPDPAVRATALEVLTEWRSPAVAKRLAEVLASPELRNMASEVLVEMGPASEKLLLEVLMQRHAGATPTVGRLLGRIAGIDGCIERLTSPDPTERLRGVEALGAMGGPRAVESLVGTLSDPDSTIRVRSLQLLGKLGDDRAGSAIEHSARTDPVAEVVTAAEEALERLANAEAAQQ
ncbi:MAG: HEAT repeat domain-containing protein [Actinomycetota bacterium]|nr:HEAT repeat domain-containing protein [Actinomycetota bacterium]